MTGVENPIENYEVLYVTDIEARVHEEPVCMPIHKLPMNDYYSFMMTYSPQATVGDKEEGLTRSQLKRSLSALFGRVVLAEAMLNTDVDNVCVYVAPTRAGAD